MEANPVQPAGLVETSSNLAAVRCVPEAGAPGRGDCSITCSSRSSLMPALEAVRASIAKLAGLVRRTSCVACHVSLQQTGCPAFCGVLLGRKGGQVPSKIAVILGLRAVSAADPRISMQRCLKRWAGSAQVPAVYQCVLASPRECCS